MDRFVLAAIELATPSWTLEKVHEVARALRVAQNQGVKVSYELVIDTAKATVDPTMRKNYGDLAAEISRKLISDSK